MKSCSTEHFIKNPPESYLNNLSKTTTMTAKKKPLCKSYVYKRASGGHPKR